MTGNGVVAEALDEWIHIMISYNVEDELVTIYRNGEQYGDSYKPAGGFMNINDQVRAMACIRHLRTASLIGTIAYAAIHEGAKTPADVTSCFGADVFLSNLQVSSDLIGWNDGGPKGVNSWFGHTTMLMGNGHTYNNFLVIHPPPNDNFAYKRYTLNGDYSRFSAVVGVARSSNTCVNNANYGSFRVDIVIDNVVKYTRTGYDQLGEGSYDNVDIDVSGANVLEIRTYRTTDNYYCDHPAIANPLLSSCGNGCDYAAFENEQACVVSGDPHWVLWNGNRHDFQGQPSQQVNGLFTDQFYYVHPCCGSTRGDMPFSILGRHVRVGGRVSGLDYLTIKLYEDGTEENVYYAWFSSSIHGYIHKSDAVSTYYDDNEAAAADISTVTDTIGSKFKIEYTQINSREINVKIIIDNTCDVEFYMKAQGNYRDGRYKMHYLRITPAECYKCDICGLCGDFEIDTTGTTWEDSKTCNGGTKSYRQGYGTEAFDIYGWSWEQANVDEHCDFWAVGGDCTGGPSTPDTSSPDTSSGVDAPDLGSASCIAAATIACQSARDANNDCCNKIGPKFCIDQKVNCPVDSCMSANDDVSQLPGIIQTIFTDVVTAECTLSAGAFPNPPQSYTTDECAARTDDCNDVHGTCTDTETGYTCACATGYVGDGVICEDENECDTGNHDCDTVHGSCNNLVGTYSCACNDGWTLDNDGATCSDIDECGAKNHNCDTVNGRCINTQGSYECKCKDGFSGNGETCTDNDECADGSHSCDTHAGCSNTEGSYECECNGPEWIGNGESCELASHLMMCNLPITALYDGSSVDLSAGIWKDRTGNGNDGIITGSGGATYDGLDESNSLYLRDQEIFYGTPTTHVSFPMTVTPKHSVINLCKYNGAVKGRIVQSSTNNIVFGFWGGRSGLAYYYNTWLEGYPNRFGDQWVLSMQSNTQYYANGVKYSTRTGPEVAPGTLGINYGQTGEYSDFACAEVIVINDVILNDEQRECFEEHFNEKYAFDIVAPEFTEPVSICNVPITALYDTDGIHLNTHTWADSSGNGNDAQIYGGGNIFDKLDTSNPLYLNDRRVFYGTPSTNVRFPVDVSAQHTVLNVCKYNGASRRRILQSSANNIVFGFWNGKSGVAHYLNQWLTDYNTDRFGDNWVLSIQSNTQYYANGVDYAIRAGPQVVPGKLGINYGHVTGEYSDFACVEVIIINDIILNDEQKKCFADYLNDKYALYDTTEPFGIPFVKFNAWDYRIIAGVIGILIMIVIIFRFYCSKTRKVKSAGYGVVNAHDSEYASDVPLNDDDIKA